VFQQRTAVFENELELRVCSQKGLQVSITGFISYSVARLKRDLDVLVAVRKLIASKVFTKGGIDANQGKWVSRG